MMDHKEKHHEHHKKQREHEDRLKKERERQEESLPRRVHPAWFVVLGSALIVVIILVWTWL
jgi:hypothetical protein